MSYNVSEKLLALNMIFILYYLLHMKMKKLLVGAFLGMFALTGVAVLPNYANATDWAHPDADKNELSQDQTLTGSAFLDTVTDFIVQSSSGRRWYFVLIYPSLGSLIVLAS